MDLIRITQEEESKDTCGLIQNYTVTYSHSNNFIQPEAFASVTKKQNMYFKFVQIGEICLFGINKDFTNATYRFQTTGIPVLKKLNNVVVPDYLNNYKLVDAGCIRDSLLLILFDVKTHIYEIVTYHCRTEDLFSFFSSYKFNDKYGQGLVADVKLSVGNEIRELLYKTYWDIYAVQFDTNSDAYLFKLVYDGVITPGFGFKKNIYAINFAGCIKSDDNGKVYVIHDVKLKNIISISCLNNNPNTLLFCVQCVQNIYYVVLTRDQSTDVIFQTEEQILAAFICYDKVCILFSDRYCIKLL